MQETMSQSAPPEQNSLSVAAEAFNSGDLERADYLCRKIVKENSGNADALHLLALISYRRGRLSDATGLLRDALKVRAEDPELLTNLANIVKANGDLQEAKTLYEKAIVSDPKSVGAHYNLGLLLIQNNQLNLALNEFRTAVALDETVAELHFSLSNVYKALARRKEAKESCEKAISLRPDFVEAHIHLGNLLFEEEQPGKALASYQQAIDLNPKHPVALNGVGVCQTTLGEYEKAKEALSKAVELMPDVPDFHNNLGVAHFFLGEHEQAFIQINQALQQQPEFTQAYRNFGNVLADLRRHSSAIGFYAKALELDPNFYEAQLELAIAFRESGEKGSARRTFEKAAQMQPDAFAPLCGAIGSMLPNFYMTKEEVSESRAEYAQALQENENKFATALKSALDSEDALRLLQPIYLSYQGRDDRELHARYGYLMHKVIAARYPVFSRAVPPHASTKNGRIKVGIVSRHFNDHPDWRIIIGGLVKKIDRSQFELFCYSTGGPYDQITQEAESQAEHFQRGLGFFRLCEEIERDRLDILFFPEIGMDPVTMRIASLRFARAQISGWARTDTSGLPTVDYYLSPGAMEPENAQEYYEEKLLRLPGIGFYYEPRGFKDSKGEFLQQLKPDAVKFLCIQSLFKYMPQHDYVLCEIAKAIPNSQFIFTARPEALAPKMMRRLETAFASYGLDAKNHVVMLNRLSAQDFSGLCAAGDLFLDSIGFSGCLTALDAIEVDLPFVTVRGDLMRGRQSAAMLDALGLPELIAENASKYVEIACKLAQDPDMRRALSEKIANGKSVLYEQELFVRGIEDIFKSVVSK
jgi:protein O-GlcNAc transferase